MRTSADLNHAQIFNTIQTMATPKTILFLGATGGVALSALKRALAANHTCIALCRTPSKLIALLPDSTAPANLHIIQGDARDAATLARCLLPDAGAAAALSGHTQLVDAIVSSLGAYPTLRGMSDPHVCETAMRALLEALRDCRARIGAANWRRPRLVVVSTTGISTSGVRDVPLLMMPLYKVLLHAPHEDKRIMERLVIEAGAAGAGGKGEDEGLVDWTIVRGSLYTGGPETEEKVRVGVEDPVRGVVESKAVGYTISREDVGKWVWENCIRDDDPRWVARAVTVSY